MRESYQLGFAGVGDAELEADLFATSWLLCLGKDKRRDDVLLRNPQTARTLAIYFFLSVAIVLFGLLASFMVRYIPETR
jgi:hypothetical protein